MKRKILPFLMVMMFLTAGAFAQKHSVVSVFSADNDGIQKQENVDFKNLSEKEIMEMKKKEKASVVKTPYRPYKPSNSKGV